MATTNYDEGLRRMSKLVNSLLTRADCGPFREPVDWRELGLFDYPKIIKKMMDLGTVKRKLERKQYVNAKECAEDIRLIWNNCKTYNMEESDFYLLADNFSKRFEDRYKKIKAEFDTGDEDGKSTSQSRDSTGVSLDVKTKFASRIFRLSGMELGYVLQVLDLRCPQALEMPDPSSEPKDDKMIPSEVEINVDVIDSKTFAELDRYVKGTMSNRETREGEGEAEFEGDSAAKKQRTR